MSHWDCDYCEKEHQKGDEPYFELTNKNAGMVWFFDTFDCLQRFVERDGGDI